MFNKLRQKWNVSGTNLLLILITFALGGSLCGIAGRKIMAATGIEQGFIWVLVYIIILTIIWPLCVLLVSIFTGQFSFFKKYIAKMAARFAGKKPGVAKEDQNLQNPQPFAAKAPRPQAAICNVAIFASGAGSNAQQLISRFKHNTTARVALIVCNKPGAGVLHIAANAGIPVLLIEKEKFFNGDGYVQELKAHNIHLIVLAGFLWKVPASLLQHFPDAVVNIHPALLPKYGGKGMYGQRVHEAVLANKDKESGITIHHVDELYDHGANIFQARCAVEASDTPETLAAKVHALEHEHYARVVEELINAKSTLNTNSRLLNT